MAVANEGYVLNTVTQTLKGNHGFDNSLTSMRSIFMGIYTKLKKKLYFTKIVKTIFFLKHEDQPLKRIQKFLH